MPIEIYNFILLIKKMIFVKLIHENDYYFVRCEKNKRNIYKRNVLFILLHLVKNDYIILLYYL